MNRATLNRSRGAITAIVVVTLITSGASATDDEADDSEADTAAAATSCERILDAMWRTAASALTALGVQDVAAIEPRYRARATTFLERCAANLDDAQRACLEASDEPLAAQADCGILALAPRDRPFPPEITPDLPAIERPPVDADAAVALLASLAGTWHSVWESAREERTWTVEPDGSVNEVFVARGGTPETRSYRLEPQQALRIRVHTTPSSSQVYAFFMGDDDTFFLSSNLLYDVVPIPSRDRFVLPHDNHFVLVTNEGCQVFSKHGAAGIIDCSFEREGGTERLVGSFTLPDSINLQGAPIQYDIAYRVRGDHLVDERMLVFRRR